MQIWREVEDTIKDLLSFLMYDDDAELPFTAVTRG